MSSYNKEQRGTTPTPFLKLYLLKFRIVNTNIALFL